VAHRQTDISDHTHSGTQTDRHTKDITCSITIL